jgi:DNA repair protein RadC
MSLCTYDAIRVADTRELFEVLFAREAPAVYGEYSGRLRDLLGVPPKRVSQRRLLVALELGRRAHAETIERRVIRSPADTREYLLAHFQGCPNEIFTCIFLDNRHRVLSIEDLFQGTIDNTTVYPREIIRRCLNSNAAAIILAHNHPSGIAEPSEADQLITRRIRSACELIDVRLLDHFVIGGTTATSLASRGLL